MSVHINIAEVFLLINLMLYVKAQYMQGMQYPQMAQMPQLPQMPQMPQMSQMQQMPQMSMAMSPQMAMGSLGMSPSMPMTILGQSKLPVAVMPFNKKNKNSDKKKYKSKKKKRRNKKYIQIASSSESDDSESSSTDIEYRTRRKGSQSLRSKGSKKRRQVLTPVISYVTKEGYVVYQKKIKKDKAKDWLEIGRRSANKQDTSGEAGSSASEETAKKILKQKLKKIKNHRG